MSSHRGFGSDNHAGIHPEVLEAIARVNTGHQPAYGSDAVTLEFEELLRRQFGQDTRGYAVWGGTGANVCGLAALLRPYEAVIAAETAHIHTDECGALERLHGAKLLTVPTADGKLTPDAVASRITGVGDEHHVQPRVVSLSQASELGTCYSADEIRAIARVARDHGLYVHLDGARLANAAASFDCELRDLTTDAGVDVLSLGGTKNGALAAEAVVALRPGLLEDFRFVRKQSMQLASKMRFVAVQLIALLDGDLWRRNAAQANAMARRLAGGLHGLPGVSVAYPVEANAVFAALPPDHTAKLQQQWSFHVWDAARHQVRWMTAFDTTDDDIDAFLADIRTTTTSSSAS